MTSIHVVLFVVAFLCSVGIAGAVRVYAQRVNLLDVPNRRSSHEVATPRGGGLSIVVVFLVAVLVFWAHGDIAPDNAIAILAGGALIAAIGFVDDHRHVPSGWRLLAQVIAATTTVALLGGLPEFQVGNSIVDLGIVGDVLAVILMIWFTNAFNFMDGIDGLASSEASFIAGGALIISAPFASSTFLALLVILTAASLGFLRWNLPPAKIFLGDVGSAFLGFVLVAVAILGRVEESIAIWSWLILAGVFFIDATVTLLIRMFSGEKWLSAHRDHAYQKASRRYGSHGRVTMGVIVINVAWLFPLAYAASSMPQHGWWLTILAWGPLVGVSMWFGAGKVEGNSAIP